MLCTVLIWIFIAYAGGLPLVRSGNTEIQEQTLPKTQEHYMDPSCFLIGLAGGLACGLVLIVGGFLIWKFCISKNSSHRSITNRRTSGDVENQLLTPSREEPAVRSGNSRNYLEWMQQKDGLQRQYFDFKSQVDRVENEKSRIKEKIKEVEQQITESERESARDKTEAYLREKQALTDAQGELDKRKEELQGQQLEIEKLLQRAERMMRENDRMTN